MERPIKVYSTRYDSKYKYFHMIEVFASGKRKITSLRTGDRAKSQRLIQEHIKKMQYLDNIAEVYTIVKNELIETLNESSLKLYCNVIENYIGFINDISFNFNNDYDEACYGVESDLTSYISEFNSKEYLSFRSKRIKNSTLNSELRILKSFFNKAIELNLLDNNPFHNIELVEHNKRPIKFLTEESFLEEFIHFSDNKILTNFYTFGFYTGAKLTEIINLKWNDIQLEKRLIIINERVIPISFRLLEVLTKMSEEPKNEYVFTKNSKRFLSNYISHHFKDLVKKSDQNKDLHFNSLRHSFIMHCIIHGVDLFTIKEMVGLSDFNAFEKIYVNVTNEHKLKQIEKFNSDTIEFGLNDLHENKNVINKQNQKQ